MNRFREPFTPPPPPQSPPPSFVKLLDRYFEVPTSDDVSNEASQPLHHVRIPARIFPANLFLSPTLTQTLPPIPNLSQAPTLSPYPRFHPSSYCTVPNLVPSHHPRNVPSFCSSKTNSMLLSLIYSFPPNEKTTVKQCLKTFEITDIPSRWYTFKCRPAAQNAGASALELPNDAAGDPSQTAEDAPVTMARAGAVGVSGDAESGDEGSEEDDNGDGQTKEVSFPRPPALRVLYAGDGDEGERFLLAMGGWARGAIFECSWQVRLKNSVLSQRRSSFLVLCLGIQVIISSEYREHWPGFCNARSWGR